MRNRAIFVVCTTVLLLIAGVSPAGAAPPAGERITRCGQTITGPTAYLARDLTCTTGFSWESDPDSFDPGPSVAIDLRGHRLRGPGSGTAFSASGDLDKTVGLTVTNGRVDHWGTAFALGWGGLSISDVRIDHNTTAVWCSHGSFGVTDSVIDHNGTGGSLFDGSLTFRRTLFTANDLGSFGGSSYASLDIDQSAFVGNKVGVTVYPSGDTTVTNSAFTGNGVGFQGREGVEVTLTGNTFVGNQDGIHIESAPREDSLTSARLGSNVAHHNKRYGIYAPVATDLGGNRAWNNGKPCVGVVCQGRS